MIDDAVKKAEERLTYDEILSSRRLLAAILLRAVKDLGRAGELAYGELLVQRQRAMTWFESGRTDPGSFRWVCQGMRIDADQILRDIRDGAHEQLYWTRLEQDPDRFRRRFRLRPSAVARRLGLDIGTVRSILGGHTRSHCAPRENQLLNLLEASA